jgi:NAD(P) transhydrogenase subunit alpha
VVVDLAAEADGNCELTEPGETVERHGVKILGPLDLAAQMPDHASQLYARNVQSLLELMISEEGELEIDWNDEVLVGTCVTHDSEIVHLGARQAAAQPTGAETGTS